MEFVPFVIGVKRMLFAACSPENDTAPHRDERHRAKRFSNGAGVNELLTGRLRSSGYRMELVRQLFAAPNAKRRLQVAGGLAAGFAREAFGLNGGLPLR